MINWPSLGDAFQLPKEDCFDPVRLLLVHCREGFGIGLWRGVSVISRAASAMEI
jgi:hypothetical protein